MKKTLKKHYLESWNFIKESKKHIYIIIGVFLFFFLFGFFIPTPENIAKTILDFIDQLIEQTKDMGLGELFLFIFLNNLKASFIGMIFGVFLGIAPILFMLINGYLLGFVSKVVTTEDGLMSLWKLLPHGIFELPAVFISLGLGVKLGTFIFKKQKMKTLDKYLLSSLKIFLFIIIPLLILAAIIESGLIIFLR